MSGFPSWKNRRKRLFCLWMWRLRCGSPVGKDNGKVTIVEGVDPNKNPKTGSKDEEDEDERIDFCVASIKKSDLTKKKE